MKLRVFLAKRLIHTFITLLVVLTLLFVLFRLMPSDPASMMIDPNMDQSARDQLAVRYGFKKVVTHPNGTREYVDKSYGEQYLDYMKGMLTFDFGESFQSGQPVWWEIQKRAPPTLLLFGTSAVLAYILGIVFGAILAWKRGTGLELGAIVVSLLFYAMPLFWLGLIMISIFASADMWKGEHWFWEDDRAPFPVGGMETPGTDYHGLERAKDILWHMALPLITMKLISFAGMVLTMRNSMLEVMGEDYITTARAKGLSERTVLYKHAARNALLPIVTSMAISFGFVLGGGVITELVFSWPGMGRALVQSTIGQDFPMVQGLFYLMAIMTILANLVADLMYAYLDPRVQL